MKAVAHCEQCHPYGEKDAEREVKLTTPAGIEINGICDAGHPHTCRLCLEHYESDEDPKQPEIDDSVKFCPNCERPNQFGELCEPCRREE